MTLRGTGRRPLLLGAAALLVAAIATGAVAFLRADAAPTSLGTSLGSPAPSDGHCAVRLAADEPAWASLPPSPVPTSRLVVSAELPTPWLQKAIGEQVPTRLASSSGQSIGAAGRVSYDVTRGDFSFEVEGDHLWVRLPVAVQANVCKPFAGYCPVYGSCAPSLRVGVGVPLMIDLPDPAARTSLKIDRGCSIAGLDVTDRIESQAAQQLGSVKVRIDAAIPSAERRSAALALALAPRPIPGEPGCVRLSATRIVQAPPEVSSALSLRLMAEGTLALGSCTAEAAPSPKIERGELKDGSSDLVIAAQWPWAELMTVLTPSFGDHTVRLTALRGALVEGAPRIVMTLELDGEACGPLWVRAQPVVRDGKLAFERVDLMGGSRLPPDANRSLMERLQALRAPLPKSAATMTSELARIETIVTDGTARMPPEVDLAVRIAGAPPALEVVPVDNGVRLVARRRLTLVVAPRTKPAEP